MTLSATSADFICCCCQKIPLSDRHQPARPPPPAAQSTEIGEAVARYNFNADTNLELSLRKARFQSVLSKICWCCFTGRFKTCGLSYRGQLIYGKSRTFKIKSDLPALSVASLSNDIGRSLVLLYFLVDPRMHQSCGMHQSCISCGIGAHFKTKIKKYSIKSRNTVLLKPSLSMFMFINII